MVRQLLENLGCSLTPQIDVGEPCLKRWHSDEDACGGHFSGETGGAAKAYVDPAQAVSIRDNDGIRRTADG